MNLFYPSRGDVCSSMVSTVEHLKESLCETAIDAEFKDMPGSLPRSSPMWAPHRPRNQRNTYISGCLSYFGMFNLFLMFFDLFSCCLVLLLGLFV